MRVQPRDGTLFRVLRFKAAELLREPLHLSVRLRRPSQNPDEDRTEAAELARQSLESLLFDSLTGFEEVSTDMAWGALGARAWVAAVDFVPDAGPFGEIQVRSFDPRNFSWDSMVKMPHDRACRYVDEIARMPLSQIRRMKGWQHTGKDELFADDGENPVRVDTSSGPGGSVRLSTDGGMPQMGEAKEKRVTILKRWYRRGYEKVTKPTAYKMLPEDQRHLACGTDEVAGCGWKSPTEGELGMVLPDADTCPECGQVAELVSHTVNEEISLRYPKGRLVIIPLFNEHLSEPLYDGKWPQPLRTFPYWWFTAYPDPLDPIGQSETSLLWTDTVCANYVMRQIVEQLGQNKDYRLIPRTGLEDFTGATFNFSDANGINMFYTSDYPPQGVQFFQGSGIPKGAMEAYGLLHGNMKENEGSSDLPLAPGETKDIPVGTVRQLTTTGNVPIDDQVRRFKGSRAIFLNVIHDMQVATQFPAREMRLRQRDGSDQFRMMSGADIPPSDFEITESSSFDAVDERTLKGFQAIISTPPQYRAILVRAAKLDPAMLREIEQAEAKAAVDSPPDQLTPGPQAPVPQAAQQAMASQAMPMNGAAMQ